MEACIGAWRVREERLPAARLYERHRLRMREVNPVVQVAEPNQMLEPVRQLHRAEQPLAPDLERAANLGDLLVARDEV